MNDDKLLPLSARPDFIALPSDPKQLTPEQVMSIFGGDVDGVLREIIKLGMSANTGKEAKKG